MNIVPTPTTDVSQAIRVTEENISVLYVYRDPDFEKRDAIITYKGEALEIFYDVSPAILILCMFWADQIGYCFNQVKDAL